MSRYMMDEDQKERYSKYQAARFNTTCPHPLPAPPPRRSPAGETYLFYLRGIFDCGKKKYDVDEFPTAVHMVSDEYEQVCGGRRFICAILDTSY